MVGWWVGWLVDIPGVNAQEKTREELIESLRLGALWLTRETMMRVFHWDPEQQGF